MTVTGWGVVPTYTKHDCLDHVSSASTMASFGPFQNFGRGVTVKTVLLFHRLSLGPVQTLVHSPIASMYGIFWVVPLPSNSHHQDCYVCSRGSQPKPSFATGILGGGDNPRSMTPYIYHKNQPNGMLGEWSPWIVNKLTQPSWTLKNKV